MADEAVPGRREQAKRKPKKLDGEKEAQLVALACPEPPEGRSGWTLELLRGRLVELKIVDGIATETAGRAMK